MALWRVGLRSMGLASHYQRDPGKACYLAQPVSCPGNGNNTHPMEAVVRNVIFHIRKPLPTETTSSSLEMLLQEIKRGPSPMPGRKPASLGKGGDPGRAAKFSK